MSNIGTEQDNPRDKIKRSLPGSTIFIMKYTKLGGIKAIKMKLDNILLANTMLFALITEMIFAAALLKRFGWSRLIGTLGVDEA